MKKISVIIPCHNVAEYIDVCLEHIIGQTIGLENIEIIVIDDVSTDNTVDILKKYEKAYPDNIILIINDTNIGAGGSRNEAVQYASGEYIAYCDADDWYTEEAFAFLYETAKNCDADVVEFDYTETAEHNGISEKKDFSSVGSRIYELDSKIIREQFFTSIDTKMVCWNKIYKKSFILTHKIEFAAGMIYEEPPFTQSIKLYMDRYIKVNASLYYYYRHAGSDSTKFWEKRFDMMKSYCKFFDDAVNNGIYAEYKELIDFSFWCGCYYMPMINMVSKNLFYQLDEYAAIQNMIRKRCGDIRTNRLYREAFGTDNLLGTLSYNDVSEVSMNDIKLYIANIMQ